MIAEEERQGVWQTVEHRSITTLDSLFHDRQRCGAGLCIEIGKGLSYLRPCGHLRRESYQQGCTSYECRIEQIVTQSSEWHFGKTDGEKGTDNDDPQRKVGRKVKGKEQSGEHGRTVAYGGALITEHVFVYGPLEEHTCCNTCCSHDDRSYAEEPKRSHQSRQQGDDDAIHVALDGISSMSMGR